MQVVNSVKRHEFKILIVSFSLLFIFFFSLLGLEPSRERIKFIIPRKHNQIDQLVQIYFNDREYIVNAFADKVELSPLKNVKLNFEVDLANFENNFYSSQNNLKKLLELSKNFIPKNSSNCADVVKCSLNEYYISTKDESFKSFYSEFMNKDLNGPVLNQNTNLTAFLATPSKGLLIDYKVEKVGFSVWYQKKILLAFFGALSFSLILSIVMTKRPWNV